MPVTLGEKRGFLVLGIALLLLMTLAAWLNSDRRDQDEGHPSSYSAKSHGAKAAYLVLLQSGYPIERWEKSPADLPADATGVMLVLAGPESYPWPEEHNGIIRFLSRGGAVLLAGSNPDLFIPQSSAEFGDGRVGLQECKPAAPTHLTRGGTVSQDGNLVWNRPGSAAVIHFKDQNDKPVVVSYSLGRGKIIWWASALPLRNDGILDRGNLDLLLNSVGDSKRILWDEYYHQEHAFDSAHHENTAQLWALTQVALFGILVVLTFSRRSGPVVPLARELRLSPLEFVETLGNVFQRARGTQVAVEIALNRFQQMVVRRLGIRGTSGPAEMVLAISQHGLKLPPEVAKLVSESGDAVVDAELSEKRALEYVRALVQAMRLFDVPTGKKEKEKEKE